MNPTKVDLLKQIAKLIADSPVESLCVTTSNDPGAVVSYLAPANNPSEPVRGLQSLNHIRDVVNSFPELCSEITRLNRDIESGATMLTKAHEKIERIRDENAKLEARLSELQEIMRLAVR